MTNAGIMDYINLVIAVFFSLRQKLETRLEGKIILKYVKKQRSTLESSGIFLYERQWTTSFSEDGEVLDYVKQNPVI